MLGEPEQWLTHDVLEASGYANISFDFFINWATGSCQNEIWLKRISSVTIAHLFDAGTDYLEQAADSLGDNLHAIHDFAASYKLRPFYQVFRDQVNWFSSPDTILKAQITATGFVDLKRQSLQELMGSIRSIRGGPVNIGRKGLVYGTSTLECYLSRTDCMWPGDVDCVLWSTTNKKASAILEFKKHTLDSPVGNQQLRNYYPHPDGRKYNALALLRDRLDKETPLVIVYYPTNPTHNTIKIERVSGGYEALRSVASCGISLKGKTKPALGQEIIDAVHSLT